MEAPFYMSNKNDKTDKGCTIKSIGITGVQSLNLKLSFQYMVVIGLVYYYRNSLIDLNKYDTKVNASI